MGIARERLLLRLPSLLLLASVLCVNHTKKKYIYTLSISVYNEVKTATQEIQIKKKEDTHASGAVTNENPDVPKLNDKNISHKANDSHDKTIKSHL